MGTSTRWTYMKKPSDAQLDGITIEADMVNDTVEGITLTDKFGSQVRVTVGKYIGLNVLVPAPPKMVKKFVVAGKLLGVTQMQEEFETEREANERLLEIKRNTNQYEDEILGVKVAELEVPE